MRHLSEAIDKIALAGLTNDKFLVMEDMILETRQGDLKYPMGEEIVLGVNESKDQLVIRNLDKDFVTNDPAVITEIVKNVTCKEELSDVKYNKLTFVEAKDMRIVSSKLIKAVADSDEIRKALKDAQKRKDSLHEMKKTGIALPMLERVSPIGFQAMKTKIVEHVIPTTDKAYEVEAVEIHETPAFAKNCLMLDNIRLIMDEAKKDVKNVGSADELMADVDGIEGANIEMQGEGDNEEMVAKNGMAVIGYFDKKTKTGLFFPAGTFATVEDAKAAFKDAGVELKDEKALEDLIKVGEEDKVEEALESFINSDKSEAKVEECKTALKDCGLTDEAASNVMECFK